VGIKFFLSLFRNLPTFIHAFLGAQYLVNKPFPGNANRFDAAFRGLYVTRMDPSGHAEAVCNIDEGLGNSYGSLHGGATSTLVDIMGTLALLAKDHKRGGVSIDLNVSFLNAAPLGSKIICKGAVLKLGKNLGFTEVEILNEEGKIIATGRHTKAFPASPTTKRE
jgi:acyl-coenzyme A thioesterase 13